MIHFERPLAGLLLFLPWIIHALLPQVRALPHSALLVPFYQRVLELLEASSARSYERLHQFFFYGLWCLLVASFASPYTSSSPLPFTQEGRHIFLVLDLSASMEIPDMVLHHRSATRLDVVKQAAEQFVRARVDDHIGLILFGSQAYLQTPLTYDHANVLERLEDASVGLAGKTTAIGDAIGLAVKKLETTPKQGRIIILLTDGANNSGVLPPLKAAEIARDEHIKIYTIGLSTQGNQNNLASLFMSMQAGGELDEDTLKMIAKTTHGQYYLATDTHSLEAIYTKINQLETSHQQAPPLQIKDLYYPYLLGMWMILLMLWIIHRYPLYPKTRA